jgi:hypothetical protein
MIDNTLMAPEPYDGLGRPTPAHRLRLARSLAVVRDRVMGVAACAQQSEQKQSAPPLAAKRRPR